MPILCSLRMSDASLHGNDVRQTNYDSYVLLPETLIDKNIFANSFAVRRRATQQDADFLPMAEYPCNATEPGRPTTPANLGLEKRAALLLGGESVPTAIIKSLLINHSGKPILNSHGDMLVCHHYTPLDGGLELFLLKQNLVGPVQYRCCSFGLDAEGAQMALSKVARNLLLDWKNNANKLLPAGGLVFNPDLSSQDAQRFAAPPVPADFSMISLNRETQLPEISVNVRKKWADDPVYAPEWIQELSKADEILTSPAARAIIPGEGGAGEGGAQGQGIPEELPDEWKVKEKSVNALHECQSEISNVTIHVAEHEGSVQVFLTAARAMTIPADEVLFKLASGDWFKPPKSTRLLASDSENHLHVFEVHTDEAMVT